MINKKIIISTLPMILTSCSLICFIPLSHSEDVYITIGKGFGSPGSKNNPVIIMLGNPLNQVRGVQLEICDEGNHLSSIGCDPIDRASEFLCQTNDLRNGCTRVILYSVGKIIEEGQGPIIVIDYDVKENAPSGQCISLSLNKKNTQVSDENNKPLNVTAEPGEFCFEGGGGDETSTTTTKKTPITTTTIPSTKTTTIKTTPDNRVTTIPKTTVPEIPDTTRTTTHRNLTTPRAPAADATATNTTIREPATEMIEPFESPAEVPPETTTTPLSSPYQISISPSSVTLNSGEMVEFRANTIADGEKLKGAFKWEIIPASTIGSTINEIGLFTAGNNTSDFTIKESVRVTDTLHENSEATVTVTINIKKPSPIGCELSISPSSVTLFSRDTITFSARNFGERCAEGSYKWKILSKIDSYISRKGIYTAGNNESGDSTFDIVIVEDTTNDIKADAMVTVLSKEKVAQVAPNATHNPLQGAFSLKSLLIIIIFLIILTSIVLFWKIKR